MKQLAVIVGRFQVNYLTAGHIDFVNRTLDENENVLIVLGVAPAQLQPDNILTFEMRKQMFTKLFPTENLRFTSLRDVGDDKMWSQHLDKLLKMEAETLGFDSTKVYGSRDSFLNSYNGTNTPEAVPHRYSASGTALRAKIMETKEFSDDFRAGMIYCATNRFPITYPTVDVIVGRKDFTEILLVRKVGRKDFVIIGGFAEPHSEDYEEDAGREVAEESGYVIKRPTYIGSRKIDDWRYRKGPDKLKTLLFAAEALSEGQITDTDEIAEAKWFPLEKVPSILVQHHKPLWDMFCAWTWSQPNIVPAMKEKQIRTKHPLIDELFGPTSSWQLDQASVEDKAVPKLLPAKLSS